MKILSDWKYTTPGGFPYRAVELTEEEKSRLIPLEEYLRGLEQDSPESKDLCGSKSDK